MDSKTGSEIVVSPKNAVIYSDGQQQFRAYKISDNGVTEDVTSIITWISSDNQKVDLGQPGLAIPITPEISKVYISAQLGELYDNAALTVLHRPEGNENQVQNSGFESDLVGWDPGCAVIRSDEAHDGAKSAYLDAPGCSMQQTILGLLPNTNYSLMVWVKGIEVESQFGKANIKAQPCGGTGNTVLSIGDGSWGYTSVPFTTDSECTSVVIIFQHVQGSVYIDEVSVLKI